VRSTGIHARVERGTAWILAFARMTMLSGLVVSASVLAQSCAARAAHARQRRAGRRVAGGIRCADSLGTGKIRKLVALADCQSN
jgi:hypothetical protein